MTVVKRIDHLADDDALRVAMRPMERERRWKVCRTCTIRKGCVMRPLDSETCEGNPGYMGRAVPRWEAS